ncbi:MAG: response regulator [Dehalococcoidia bacterium]|nr:MAG: response regulator [Dehalococcoidia bacterium]
MVVQNASMKTALVVEDQPVIARVCAKTLRGEGFAVDLAVNGTVGCRMANDKRYDLFVADIRTPEMNGISFYRHVELAHPDLAHRVIFTTGDVLSSEIRAFLDEIKPGFLPKPFTPTQLRTVVRQTLQWGAA